MYATEYPYAGLILPDAQDLDPRPYLNAARRVLAKLDPHPNGGSRVNAESNLVRGGFFGLRVTPQEDSDYGPRMVLEVVTKEGTPTEDEAAAQILSDTVLSALKDSPADIIEWYSPDVLLDAEDFIRLRSYVSPRRGKVTPAMQPALTSRVLPDPAPLTDTVAPLAKTPEPEALEPLLLNDSLDIDWDAPEHLERDVLSELYDTSEEKLNDVKRAEDASETAENQEETRQKSRISAAGWLMAAIVSVVYFPVGIALFIIGIFRGMEFRLVSQVLIVTSLFVVLHNTDRLNMVLRQLLY